MSRLPGRREPVAPASATRPGDVVAIKPLDVRWPDPSHAYLMVCHNSAGHLFLVEWRAADTDAATTAFREWAARDAWVCVDTVLWPSLRPDMPHPPRVYTRPREFIHGFYAIPMQEWVTRYGGVVLR